MKGIPSSIVTGRAIIDLERQLNALIEFKFRNSRRGIGEQYAEECAEFTIYPQNDAEPVVFSFVVNTLYQKVIIKCDTLTEHTARRIYGFSRVFSLDGSAPHSLAAYAPAIKELLEDVALVQKEPRGTYPFTVPPYTRAVWNEAQFELILQEARAKKIVAALEDTEVRGGYGTDFDTPKNILVVYIRTTAGGHAQLLEMFKRLEARNKELTERIAQNIAQEMNPTPPPEVLAKAASKLGAPAEEVLAFGWFHAFGSTAGPRGGAAGCAITSFPVYGFKWTDSSGRIHAVKECADIWRSWDGNTGGW